MNSTLNTPAQFSNLLAKYLLWVFWNTLGFALTLPAIILGVLAWSSIISLVMAWSPNSPVLSLASASLSIILVVIISLVIALFQGIALGIRKIHIRSWVLANTLTWAIFIALAINWASELFSSNMWAGTILRGIIAGVLIGIPQGFLMQKANRASWWWILASILGSIGGFAVAVSIAMSILHTLGEKPGIAIFSIVPFFGFVSSIITGLFLLRPIRWFDS